MELAENWWMRHVFERVMHPAHVPFESESQAAQVGRLRDTAPGSRFFSDCHSLRMLEIDSLVQPAQEVNRFDVLTTAVFVGHPSSVLAIVVEVEH